MERWYHRDHSAEIARRYGPWLARHESYLPVDAPVDARECGPRDVATPVYEALVGDVGRLSVRQAVRGFCEFVPAQAA